MTAGGVSLTTSKQWVSDIPQWLLHIFSFDPYSCLWGRYYYYHYLKLGKRILLTSSGLLVRKKWSQEWLAPGHAMHLQNHLWFHHYPDCLSQPGRCTPSLSFPKTTSWSLHLVSRLFSMKMVRYLKITLKWSYLYRKLPLFWGRINKHKIFLYKHQWNCYILL